MSFAAVMVAAVALSVTVVVAMAVAGSPTTKVWFAAPETVGAAIVMVWSSARPSPRPTPDTTLQVVARRGPGREVVELEPGDRDLIARRKV